MPAAGGLTCCAAAPRARGCAEYWAYGEYGWLLFQEGQLEHARTNLEAALDMLHSQQVGLAGPAGRTVWLGCCTADLSESSTSQSHLHTDTYRSPLVTYHCHRHHRG